MKLEIDLDLPDEITDAGFEEQIAKPARRAIVLRLFAEDRIPSGLATRLLGLTRREFLELLKHHGIPHTGYTFEDFREDTETMEQFLSEKRAGEGDGRGQQ